MYFPLFAAYGQLMQKIILRPLPVGEWRYQVLLAGTDGTAGGT